jgi:hypothetical protein
MLSDRATAMEEGDVRFGSKAEMQRNRSALLPKADACGANCPQKQTCAVHTLMSAKGQ